MATQGFGADIDAEYRLRLGPDLYRGSRRPLRGQSPRRLPLSLALLAR